MTKIADLCFHKEREISAVDGRILVSEEGFLQWS